MCTPTSVCHGKRSMRSLNQDMSAVITSTCAPIVHAGVPASAICNALAAPASAASPSCSWRSTRARNAWSSPQVVVSAARRAAVTAMTTSSGRASAARPTTVSSLGFTTSKRPPPVASRNSPPM